MTIVQSRPSQSTSVAAPGSNQGYGVDAAFQFYQNVAFAGYYARTTTPNVTTDDDSYQGQFDYAADRYGAHLEYMKVGDNFNPEVGFVARDNFKRTYTTARFSPRPKSMKAVRKFTYQANLDYFANGAGAMETRLETGMFSAELDNSVQSVRKDLAQDYYEQGLRIQRTDLDAAIRLWERCLEYDPTHAQARTRLDQARRMQRNLKSIPDASSKP